MKISPVVIGGIIIVLAVLIFTVMPAITYSQNVFFTGKAPTYAGDKLTFYTNTDLVTNTKKDLCSCTVGKDGKFTCSFIVNETRAVYIDIEVFKGIIYVEPDNNYTIFLPEKIKKTTGEKLNPFFVEASCYIGLDTTRKDELNYLLKDFDDVFEFYISSYFYDIYRKARKSNVDTIVNKIEHYFSGFSNKYFNDYKKYKLALLRYLAYERDIKFVTKDYFLNKPVLYFNDAYMGMFNQMYDKYFSWALHTQEIKEIYNDVVLRKSFNALKETLEKAMWLRNDTLKELVILKGLHDCFYTENTGGNTIYPHAQLFQVLDSVRILSKIPLHREIAVNIKNKVTRLMTGYPAPPFELKGMDSATVQLSRYKGKFVYLNFCNTQSYECLVQLSLLDSLFRKYNKEIDIISISTDERFETAIDYFKKNKYGWTLADYSKCPGIIKDYNIKIYPTYYLIDKSGNLLLSPAPSPGENFEYTFIKIYNPELLPTPKESDDLFKKPK